jgi:mRNA interferase MazF
MCPITSKQKGYPFEVSVDGNTAKGVILADQVKSLDWRAREARFEERANDETIAEVSAKIEALIKV